MVRNYGDVSGVTGVAACRREGCRPLSRQMMTTEVITLVVGRVRPLVDGRGRTLIATGVIDSTVDIVREKGRHPSNQRHRNYERQYLGSVPSLLIGLATPLPQEGITLQPRVYSGPYKNVGTRSISRQRCAVLETAATQRVGFSMRCTAACALLYVSA